MTRDPSILVWKHAIFIHWHVKWVTLLVALQLTAGIMTWIYIHHCRTSTPPHGNTSPQHDREACHSTNTSQEGLQGHDDHPKALTCLHAPQIPIQFSIYAVTQKHGPNIGPTPNRLLTKPKGSPANGLVPGALYMYIHRWEHWAGLVASKNPMHLQCCMFGF